MDYSKITGKMLEGLTDEQKGYLTYGHHLDCETKCDNEKNLCCQCAHNKAVIEGRWPLKCRCGGLKKVHYAMKLKDTPDEPLINGCACKGLDKDKKFVCVCEAFASP